MNKVSRVKNNDFTTISNVFLRDKNLTLKAKGFLAVIMGLPDNWEFSINGICSIIKEGKSCVYSIIDELKENKYCIMVTCRDGKGKITGNDYTFYEEPYLENPYMEKPNVDNPYMENQPQLNTKEIKDTRNKENNNINFVEIQSIWEEINPSLPSIRGFNEKRKKALRNLLKNNNATIDDLHKAFKIISVCTFCQGENDRKWVATLDWLLNDTKGCFNRLLEGAYAFNDSEKQKVKEIVDGIEQETNNNNLFINGQEYR